MTENAMQELEELREQVASMRQKVARLQQAHDARHALVKKPTRKRTTSPRAKTKEQLLSLEHIIEESGE